MTFPLGRPILFLLLIALASGAAIVARPAPPHADLTLWTFASSHAKSYRGDGRPGSAPSLVEQFRWRTGHDVRVDLVASRALDVRLASLFMSGEADGLSADLVEVEISSVGRFFRPPVERVGFLPLNDYLRRSGLDQRIVPTRFAPWTKQGVIFGVPHDVHPVTLTYRKDLFDQAGVDLASAGTWREFQERCLTFQTHWHRAGVPHRRSIELPSGSADVLVMMLLQRGINLLDDHGGVNLTHPRVSETIAFYAGLVAGPGTIGADTPRGEGLWARDLEQGRVCAALTPDWRVDSLRTFAPELAGKLAMMPLPRFDPSDAPTSTWGGTMIGIPRVCPNPDAAWELLTFLYLSSESLAARRRYSTILSPVIEHWTDPALYQPDPFFGGQRVDAMFVALAPKIPPRYVTPFSALATAQLAGVLGKAVDRIDASADGPALLDDQCRDWLIDAEAELRRWIEFGTFDGDHP